MAVAVVINHSTFDENHNRGQHRATGTVTFDSSYAADGEAVDFTDTAIMTGPGGAFTTVHGCIVTNNSALAADSGLLCSYDQSGGKFQLYESGTTDAVLDPVNTSQDRSGTVVHFAVFGV